MHLTPSTSTDFGM